MLRDFFSHFPIIGTCPILTILPDFGFHQLKKKIKELSLVHSVEGSEILVLYVASNRQIKPECQTSL